MHLEIPPCLSGFTYQINKDAAGEAAPLWRLLDLTAILAQLAGAEIAIGSGQLVEIIDGEAVTLEHASPVESAWWILDEGSWRCHRVRGEPWRQYVTRSGRVAQDRIDQLLASAEAWGRPHLFFRLRWRTREESEQFTLPADMRRRLEECLGDDRSPWSVLAEARVPDAQFGAVRGSLHGLSKGTLGRVPPDAEYVSLDARTADLKALDQLPQLEILALQNVTPRALESLGKLSSLRILVLSHVKVRDLAPLRDMPRLECLSVTPTLRSLDLSALAALQGLRVLTLHSRALEQGDSGLQHLRQLRCLELLTGGPGAGARVNTLQPLQDLTELRRLYLGHLKVADQSLRPLHALRHLRRLELYSSFPLEEAAALAVALPEVQPDLRSPFRPVSGSQAWALVAACRRCHTTLTVLTRTSPARRLCPQCNARKVREYVARWEILLAQGARA